MEQGGHPDSTFTPSRQAETVGGATAPPTSATDQQEDVATSSSRARDEQAVVSTTPSATDDAATRLLTTPTSTALPHPDAELLRLGAEFEAGYAAWQATISAANEAHRRADAYIKRHSTRFAANPMAVTAEAWAIPGVAGPSNAEEEALGVLDPLTEQIFALSPITASGLAVMARAAVPGVWINGMFEKDAGKGEDEDWSEQCVRKLINACLSLAERERNGTLEAQVPPVAAVPGSLADECNKALAHIAWIHATSIPEGWEDERLNTEMAVHDRAVRRAINEPSATLGDVIAKARLAREDLERLLSEGDLDDGDRLVISVLREVGALDPALLISPSSPEDSEIASLAAAFCDAYAKATRSERAYMADEITEDEWQPHHDAAQALMDQLSHAEPKTIVGMGLKCLAVAGSDAWQIPRGDDPAKDGFTTRIARQFETAILAGSLAPIRPVPPTDRAVPDPIHAAIAASRKAQAAYETWERGARGRMTKAKHATEDRLVAEQTRARKAAFATVPTTRGGQLALLDYARWQLDLRGQGDGADVDVEVLAWREPYRALEASLRAGVATEQPSPPSVSPDLSSLTVHELWHLSETYRASFMWWGRVSNEPWAWDDRRENHSAAGHVVEGEYRRHMDTCSSLHEEARRRDPVSNDERDDLLEMRLAHEMECNGRIHDPALLADINAAWGGVA